MRTKRVASLFLSLMMLFTLSVPALAAETPEVPQLSSAELVDGTIYVRETSVQRTVVTVPENDTWMEINFCLISEPDTVYQFFLEDVTVSELGSADSADWEWILEACEDRQATASKIYFTRLSEETAQTASVFSLNSAIGTNLVPEMRARFGEEYEGQLLYMSSIYGGQSIKIYERMDFQILQEDAYEWSAASGVTSIAGLITGIMGLSVTSTLVSALSIVLGVEASASAPVPGSGEIVEYECRALVGRYTSVNDSEYIYTITDHVMSYIGYDDNEFTSETPAAINDGTFSEHYSHSQAYYNNFSGQAQDAYNAFLRIGQQP